MDINISILETAHRLFFQQGIRYTTMDQIAQTLGISKKTIYQLYENKEELIVQSIKHNIMLDHAKFIKLINESDNIIAVMKQIGDDMYRKFQQSNPVFFDDLKRYDKLLEEKLFKPNKHLKDEALMMMLEQGKKEGVFKQELEAKIAGIFLRETLKQMKELEDLLYPEYSREDIYQNVLINYFLGIATDKGRELIKEYLEPKK